MSLKQALLSLALMSTISVLPPPATSQGQAGVLISEFRTRGPNGGNDEFIELYNASSINVDISGWQILGSSDSGNTSVRANILPGTVLGPGCHYLLTNSSPSGGPYSGSVAGDQTYGVGINDEGGIALAMPGGIIVDQVGLGPGSAYKEGSPLSPQDENTNRSYERKPGGAQGGTQDTNNNANDFSLRFSSDPQRSSSSCIVATNPTNPSGTGQAVPSQVQPGGTVTLIVTVTSGTNPASTGLTVRANLSSIGGAPSYQLFDNGTNGDTAAGDGRFSATVTVGAIVPAGPKSIPVTISDDQGRTGSTSINLTVQEANPVSCGTERWSVKTGTDIDADEVDLTRVVPTSITLMRSWSAPSQIPETRRVTPYETTVWEVYATLTQYRKTEDSDYQLVLADRAGNTILAEIPCPCCVGGSSPFLNQIASAKAKFDARLTATGSFQTVSIPVRVRGIGFFDSIEGQTGAAPNGVELHPVLDIEFNVQPSGPRIFAVSISGKHLDVTGDGFDSKAVILMNGVAKKTIYSAAQPSRLRGKKLRNQIPPGQSVKIQVRNPDGKLSNEVIFTRPAN